MAPKTQDMHSETDTDSETDTHSETRTNPETDSGTNMNADVDPEATWQPTTWRERHALKVLGVIMASMFALVIGVQVKC
jgi:hypothetical protein